MFKLFLFLIYHDAGVKAARVAHAEVGAEGAEGAAVGGGFPQVAFGGEEDAGVAVVLGQGDGVEGAHKLAVGIADALRRGGFETG